MSDLRTAARGHEDTPLPARRLFGTDGVRGPAGTFPVSGDGFYALGRGFASLMSAKSARPGVVIGRDTRASSCELEEALVRGLHAGGADVTTVGVAPSSAVAYLTAAGQFDGGGVVTASHNPASDNGVKFFARDGAKLSVEDEARLEEFARARGDTPARTRPRGGRAGRCVRFEPDLLGGYVGFLAACLPRESTLGGVRLVVDAGHGAAWALAAMPFERLGATVHRMGVAPDGTNINDSVGALHPEEMARQTASGHFDLGVALDGDGDRAVFADATGRVADGDQVLGALALEAEQRGELPGRTIVGTVLTNRGLERRLAEHRIRLLRAPVGDRNILAVMRAACAPLGGEASGHFLFRDLLPASDGLLTAIQLLAVISRNGGRASELLHAYTPTVQVAINLPLKTRPTAPELARFEAASAAAQAELGSSGVVIVRPSGTEPLLRIMVDADHEEAARAVAMCLASDLQALTSRSANPV